MKPFLRRKPQSSGIDLTPLIDIVFQLLLFFILSSAMLQPSLPLDLPGSPQKNEGTEADLVISIDAEGRIFLNDAPASLETVEPAVSALVREKPAAAVILRGDRLVQYGIFFELLDTIRNAGVKTLSLAYEEQSP
ncbi:MAG: biopolymer transporter ExbD [Treponema sp.]|jgi:biopolymer transport protein ExbD|nr:biopolymer transporter ExbD [Treponema sp.]